MDDDEMKSPPKRLQPSIIARLKIHPICPSRTSHSQDGRIQTSVGANKLIDLRVSCLPTNHGESIVMRILDKKGCAWDGELGFLSDDQQVIEKLISLRWTFSGHGATGSGGQNRLALLVFAFYQSAGS